MREKLIELRKKRGFTQDQMAEKLGVARSTYAGYEAGSFAPSLGIAVQIKKILKCCNDDIFTLLNVSGTNTKTIKLRRKHNEQFTNI